MGELPAEYRGWTVAVRRGKRGGFVGSAAIDGHGLVTHEHRGQGARRRAAQDILIQIDIEETVGRRRREEGS